MVRLKLTSTSVRERCRPPDPEEVNGNGRPALQRLYWDTELRGFGLLVGKQSKTFIVQKAVGGRSVRVTIGRLGAWTVAQARKRAREIVVQMDKGIDPNRQKREEASRGATLAEATKMHLAAMRAKGCVERSMKTVTVELERYLGDWLKRPLAEISRNECAVRHERITERSGPYAANRAFWLFRACYNTAARRLDDLPPNPVRGVTFNRMRRRREPIPWDELPAWWAKVQGLQPVRRDLQILALLTGLRSTDARMVRWEEVDLERATVHRPKPKGGEDRAFTVPLAGYLLDLLRHRRDENRILFGDDGGWAFPTQDSKGRVTHVKEMKEQRTRKKVAILPSPHRLRDTFASAAHEAQVHPLDLKLLMNHVLPASGDVTEGYIRPSVEHLRESVEKVAAFLLAKAGVAAPIHHLGTRSSVG